MTSNSPKVWAAADLDPLSPAPVHPPSPIIVPGLQDQADAYFNMSLNGSNSTHLAVATAAVTGEQTYVPAVPIHNTTNGASDITVVEAGSIHPDQAVNGVTRRAEMAPVSVAAEIMQEPETTQPHVIEAEQDVSKSNEATLNSNTSPLVSDRVDAAIPAYENCPPTMPTSSSSISVSSPTLVSQPSPSLPEDSQAVSNAIASDVDNTQLPSEQLSTDKNQSSTASSHAPEPATNVQALKGIMTARAVDADSAHIPAPGGTSVGDVLAQGALLPPKPPVPESTSMQPYSAVDGFPSDMPGAPLSSNIPLLLSNGLALNTYAGAAPGIVGPGGSTTVIPAGSSIPNHVPSVMPLDSTYGALSADQSPLVDSQEREDPHWTAFLEDERKYVSEGKWYKFPEGSRIFIGNLLSERVSKREVFDIFSKHGRLAQISIKQAYGFVQYHTVAESQAAMDNLQGMEIQGKKINLEFSRTQKKDGGGNRASRGKRDSDRHDSIRGRRDDYRPARQPSPQRSSHRHPPHDGSNRGRGYRESSYSSDRRRSQSPGYTSHDLYRRRSPSPYRQYVSASDLDLPRRYGTEVPDVQFLLLEDVKREFVSWARDAFISQGLRVDVIFLNPKFSRDALIHRQVLEGVHAVAELDFRAQEYGKINLQVFDRSAGQHNVRFDQYQDLDPIIAAQLVTRVKSKPLPPPYPSSQYPSTSPYPQLTRDHYVPPAYSNQPYPPVVSPGAGGAPLDSTTIHKILDSLNGQHGVPQPYGSGITGDIHPSFITQVAGSHGMVGPPPAQHSMGYTHPPLHVPSGAPHAGNSAQHVQDIMTQLARYRK
ncbi:hypothetical protein F4802DRAFT_218038 [Xylaria palmicola]|nr:hypothetical protein F4802DRAFT_218038 [Xylaria palmicola]